MGLSTGLAGCLGSGSGSGDVDEWFIDPFNLPNQPDEYFITSVSPTAFDEHSSEFSRDEFDDFQESILGQYDFTRFYADETDRVMQGGGGFTGGGFNVVMGDFEAEELAEDLRREDLRSRGDYEGYELFENDPNEDYPFPWAAGVESGTLLTAGSRSEEDNTLRIVEDLIDTKSGKIRRYQEVDTDFEMLMEHSSVGDFFFAVTTEPSGDTDPESGNFRDMVGVSQSIDVSADDSDVELVMVFQRDHEPRERDIEDWTREDDLFERWRDIEIDINEGNVTIGAEILTRDVMDAMVF